MEALAVLLFFQSEGQRVLISFFLSYLLFPTVLCSQPPFALCEDIEMTCLSDPGTKPFTFPSFLLSYNQVSVTVPTP